MALKIVIDNAVLRGSQQEQFWQLVATVYAPGGEEYRVYAPPKATGDALGWIEHFLVHQLSEGGMGENDVTDERKYSIITQVTENLKALKRDANRPVGMNPDGVYYDAQICLHGHVQSSGGLPFERGEHCSKCGDPCIDECLTCKAPIRGQVANSKWTGYTLPSFCHACGHPYPWMEDRLQTARELLDHDDKLNLEDREKLWGLLKYVMSDPKSDMAPAKTKLFEIGIAKALPTTREFFLDLIAKLGAEMMKP